MVYYSLITLPLIGFLIGYFTNYLAIQMLFYPRKKTFGFHGLIPSRKKQIAKNIAEISPLILPKKLRDIENLPFIGVKIKKKFQDAVENQISSLSNEEIESVVMKVAKKELRFITWTGGILGFLIGLVEAGLLII